MSNEQVEFANDDDDDSGYKIDVAAFSQAVLWGTDWTVETIVAQLRRGNIEINPRFQRRDAWSRATKSRFIESVILGLPVPQVVLAELPEQRGKYIILDGKQRLLALMQFTGLAEGTNNAFGLSGLEVKKDLLRKRFSNLEQDPSLQKDLNAFQTHTIRAVVIRNWPSLGFLHVVFQRLNTGSLKLSPQELRQALAPGEFTSFVDDKTIESKEIQQLLGGSGPDPRMRDVELLVRFISFQLFLSDYAGRMKEFLDDSCLLLNKTWEQRQDEVRQETANFIDGILLLTDVFKDKGIARKYGSRLFNRSIFDALIFYAARPDIRRAMSTKSAQVVQAYDYLIQSAEFQEAVDSDTAGMPHTAARLILWGKALAGALGESIRLPELVTTGNGEQRLNILPQ